MASGYTLVPRDLRLPPKAFALLSQRIVSDAGNQSLLTYLQQNTIAFHQNGVPLNIYAVKWLEDPDNVASLSLIPLRNGATSPAFGMLVLASPDSQRYQAGMATDFLERIAELASASLSRVRDY